MTDTALGEPETCPAAGHDADGFGHGGGDYSVTNDAGVSSQSSCRVHVPHDQSGSTAVDSGPHYCVGEGCPAGTDGSALCH